jgi:hypothetical protein
MCTFISFGGTILPNFIDKETELHRY